MSKSVDHSSLCIVSQWPLKYGLSYEIRRALYRGTVKMDYQLCVDFVSTNKISAHYRATIHHMCEQVCSCTVQCCILRCVLRVVIYDMSICVGSSLTAHHHFIFVVVCGMRTAQYRRLREQRIC